MEKVTSRDGTPIAYSRNGAGAPLVLVHGTGGASARWTGITPRLAEGFTVYAIDRRGRGGSGDSDTYMMAHEFDDVAAVVDEAALRTRNLRRLVLYEPPIPLPGVPLYPPGIIERLQELLDTGDREGVVSTFMREVVWTPRPNCSSARWSLSSPSIDDGRSNGVGGFSG